MIESATPIRLYRCFDADGVLLYIGITLDFRARWRDHRSGDYWTNYVTKVDLSDEIYYSRVEAKKAEAEAVNREVPVFNREHADIRHIEAMLQYVERAGRSTEFLEPLREKYAKRQFVSRKTQPTQCQARLTGPMTAVASPAQCRRITTDPSGFCPSHRKPTTTEEQP